MGERRVAALFGLILLIVQAVPARSEAPKGAVIGNISIHSEDVYDPSKHSENKLFFRALNAIHIRTYESVIRRELLFKEGDPYDLKKIRESERNLRGFNFLRRVRIESLPAKGGKTDLVVHTQDAWSLEPQFNFKRVGGQNSVKIGAVERNFMGTGKSISAFNESNAGRTYQTFLYRDRQFIIPHVELVGGLVNGPEGRQYGFSLDRPFYATGAPYSAGIGLLSDRQRQNLYSEQGHKIGEFIKRHREVSARAGRSLGSSSELTRRALFSYRHQSDDYDLYSGGGSHLLPAHRQLDLGEAGVELQKIDYITERHIEKFDKDEDFNVGPGVFIAVGGGPSRTATNNQEDHVTPRVGGQAGYSFSEGHFLLSKTSYRTQLSNHQSRNLIGSLSLQYYNRFSMNHTFTTFIGYDHGHRLNPDKFLTLGENNGLRAYSNNQFAGEKRVLLSVEHRVFFKDDLWHLVSLGGAVFVDSGGTWIGPKALRSSPLRNSVGLGLRIAPSRSSRNEPIKVNFAYALNDNDHKSRFVVSVISGYSFGNPGTLESAN